MIRELLEHYPKYHHFVASTQLVLAMLGMGAVLRFRDFVEIALEPKPFFSGVAFQLLLIPLLTVALMHFVELPPEIVVGFFMLAAMPGGSMSNIYTFLGRGNAALSVALTSVLTLTALVTAPLILKIFAAESLPPEIPMPAGMVVREIALFLLLPLAAGMAIGRIFPERATRFSTWAVRCSLLGLLILVIGSLGSGHLDPQAYGIRVPLLLLGYCAVLQTLVLRFSINVLRFSWRDSSTLAIETSMKNINLALLIAASAFRLEGPSAEFGGGVLFVLLFYGGSSLFVSTIPAVLNYRRDRKRRKFER